MAAESPIRSTSSPIATQRAQRSTTRRQSRSTTRSVTRTSFAAIARPSFAAIARPSFAAIARPSIFARTTTTRRPTSSLLHGPLQELELPEPSAVAAAPTSVCGILFLKYRVAVADAFHEWLAQIEAEASSFPGWLDHDVVESKPSSDGLVAVSVIMRYRSREDLRGWETSKERAHWVDKAKADNLTAYYSGMQVGAEQSEEQAVQCMHAHTHTRTRAHTHIRTHARTHTHTHAHTHTHTSAYTSPFGPVVVRK